jgi:thiamine biosynthesis lipoprotein
VRFNVAPVDGRRDARPAIQLTAIVALLLFAGCASQKPASLQRFEFERAQMGLPFRIVLYESDPARATNAAEAVWARIADLNSKLSDYEENSELSRLSRTSGSGVAVPLSNDLWRVLSRGQEIAKLSGGAFDMTVGPMVQLWRRARRQRELPTPERIAAARVASGWTNLVLSRAAEGSPQALLRVPNMRLDLGGIAKGFALDEAARVLRSHRIERYLVSGGGDVLAGEAPPGGRGWRIEVAALDSPLAPPARFLQLRKMALCTSGDLFQRVEIGGKRYSHIVDPRTGIGLTDHSLVTVIAPEAMTADALTKVVSVLGPDRGLALISGYRGAEALAVRQPGDRVESRETPGFARRFAE